MLTSEIARVFWFGDYRVRASKFACAPTHTRTCTHPDISLDITLPVLLFVFFHIHQLAQPQAGQYHNLKAVPQFVNSKNKKQKIFFITSLGGQGSAILMIFPGDS